jgi:hypothetical protein
MRRHWTTRALKFALFAVLAVALFSFVVMNLWNWLMPAVFGLRPITFWQALGLLVLSRILFGGFHGGAARRKHWRHRMAERWSQMTPEERQKFVEGMSGRCGHFEPRTTEPTA